MKLFLRWTLALPQTIVAMITSNMARAGHASRVVVRIVGQPGWGDHALDAAIDETTACFLVEPEIDRVIGTFPAAETDAALRTTLAL